MVFAKAILLLVGTVMGAGIFALPYVFSQSGFLPSLLGLVFLGVVMILLNLFYSQIILEKEGDHQLVGYVKKYLGKRWSSLALVASLISLNGALLAYVILSREFVSLSVGQISSNLYSFWFYLLVIVLFFQGFKFLIKVEFWLVTALMLLIFFLPFKLIPFVQMENYYLVSSSPLSFWGATLFALTGFTALPEVEEVLRGGRKRKMLNGVILAGGIIPIVLYFVFGFGVWGASGFTTTVDALSGLVSFSPLLIRIGAIVGLLALVTSFLSLVNAVKEIYFRDLGTEEHLAKMLAVLPASLGIFLNLGSFINVVSFIGTFCLAISGGLICLMFAKVKPRLRWLSFLVGMIFVFGALGEILGI